MSRLALNCLRILLPVLCLLSAAPPSGAAPIIGGTDYVPADTLQTVTLLPGTPLNPTGNPITFDQAASGYFLLDRATQVGSTINFTIPSADFKGALPKFLSSVPFNLEAGTPGLKPSTGAITNVVQNPASPGYATGSPSSFVSGDFTANTYFELVLANGATIYSNPSTPAVFTAHVLGLPFPAGTTFTSPGTENLYLQLGSSPNPNSDLLVGRSSNHFVTVTPEPASIALLGIGAIGMGISLRCRRKKAIESASSFTFVIEPFLESTKARKGKKGVRNLFR